MKSYKIHLLRHGLTEANERGWYLGLTDLPLSPSGLAALLEQKKKGGYPGAARFFYQPVNPLPSDTGGALSRMPAGGCRRFGGMRFW